MMFFYNNINYNRQLNLPSIDIYMLIFHSLSLVLEAFSKRMQNILTRQAIQINLRDETKPLMSYLGVKKIKPMVQRVHCWHYQQYCWVQLQRLHCCLYVSSSPIKYPILESKYQLGVHQPLLYPMLVFLSMLLDTELYFQNTLQGICLATLCTWKYQLLT